MVQFGNKLFILLPLPFGFAGPIWKETHAHITFLLLSPRILTAISSVVTNLLELIQKTSKCIYKTYKFTSLFYFVHAISDWNEIVRDFTGFWVDKFHFFIV